MNYLNEYYKSHTYESVTLEENALNKKTALKKRVFQIHLCADSLERIVLIRGFTVPKIPNATLFIHAAPILFRNASSPMIIY